MTGLEDPPYLQGADDVSGHVRPVDDGGGGGILQQLLVHQRMFLQKDNHSHEIAVALNRHQKILSEFPYCLGEDWTKRQGCYALQTKHNCP